VAKFNNVFIAKIFKKEFLHVAVTIFGYGEAYLTNHKIKEMARRE